MAAALRRREPATRRRCGRGWPRTATCSCRARSTARRCAPAASSCSRRVEAEGALDPAYPLEDGMLRPDAEELGLWQEYPASSDVLRSMLYGERMTAPVRRPARRRGPRLRLHLAAASAAEPRHRAALRPGVHGPRDAGRAHVLDAVRGHPARRRRADAARGLPPPVRRAPRRLPAAGRRHLLRQRPERGRRARGHACSGSTGRSRRPAAAGTARSPRTPSRCARSGAAAG